jgi:hypothetical protein
MTKLWRRDSNDWLETICAENISTISMKTGFGSASRAAGLLIATA